jgi:hypothetical protein
MGSDRAREERGERETETETETERNRNEREKRGLTSSTVSTDVAPVLSSTTGTGTISRWKKRTSVRTDTEA